MSCLLQGCQQQLAVQAMGPQEVLWYHWLTGERLELHRPRCKGNFRPIDGRPMTQVVVSLMWRTRSAIWVTCCTLVRTVTLPVPPDAAWPGESS